MMGANDDDGSSSEDDKSVNLQKISTEPAADPPKQRRRGVSAGVAPLEARMPSTRTLQNREAAARIAMEDMDQISAGGKEPKKILQKINSGEPCSLPARVASTTSKLAAIHGADATTGIGLEPAESSTTTDQPQASSSNAASPPPAESRPGAFRERGIAYIPNPNQISTSDFTVNNTSDILLEDERGDHTDTTLNQLDLEPVNSGLVQANLVTPSQFITVEDLEVAEPMDASDKSNTKEQSSKSMYLCFFAVCFAILAVVGLITFLVTSASSDSEQTANNTATVESPSMPPTLEPFLALLPLSTQQVILSDIGASQPQSKAYQWVLEDPNRPHYSDARLVQRFAMATFYYSTDGPNWKHQGGTTAVVMGLGPPPRGQGPSPSGQRPSPPPGGQGTTYINITRGQWLNYTTNECTWFSTAAVDSLCPGDNATIEVLDLTNNDLVGGLPMQLGLLSSLKRFSLFTNKIGGNILTELGAMSNLQQIMLNSNQISGTIPSEIGQLSDTLTWFKVLNNQLVGSIPSHLLKLSRLTELAVSQNELTGPIPNNLGDLSMLQRFLANNGQFTGTIPTSLGQCTDLSTLEISSNRLTGTLPTELGLLSLLDWLKVKENSLRGTLPSEIGLLQSIKVIWLQDNSELSGSFPHEWELLNKTLVKLSLEGTAITGTIPSGLCQVPELKFDCSPSLCGCSCPCNASL